MTPEKRKRPRPETNGSAKPAPCDPPLPSFTFDPSVTLESLRLDQSGFAKARDWDQFHSPRNVLLAMVGEVGELSELFQWRGDAGCAVGLPDWTPHDKTHLGEEMADVLLYLVRLADKCGVDLPSAAKRKLEKNAAKYPPGRCRGRAAKYTAYQTSEARAEM
jgi:dCTP diphosphatase